MADRGNSVLPAGAQLSAYNPEQGYLYVSDGGGGPARQYDPDELSGSDWQKLGITKNGQNFPAGQSPAAAGMTWRDALAQLGGEIGTDAKQLGGLGMGALRNVAGSLGAGPPPELQQKIDAAKGLPLGPPQLSGMQPPGMQPPQTPQMPGLPTMPQIGLRAAPDYSGQIDSAASEAAQGAQDAAAAETRAAQIRAANLAEVAKQQSQYAQQSQTARDAAYADTTSKMNAVSKQMQDLADQKVDPAHFWATRSGAQTAAAGLGLAFSQFGAAFTHQQPLNLISEAIDRDIQAQRDNIANRRAGLQGQANLYDRQYQIFGNHQDAADMTKAHMLDALSKQGEAAAQQAATPAIAARAMQTAGQLQQQAAALKSQVAQHNFEQQYQAGMLKLDAYGKQVQAAQLGVQRQMMLGQKSLVIGGQPVLIPDDKTREKVAQMLGAGETLSGATKENSATMAAMSIGDRAQHALSTVTDGLVHEPASYARANAAQEAAAVASNKALGSDTSQTEQQYKNMRASLNTPGAPAAAAGAGHVLRGDAKLALYSQLAAVPTIGPRMAAQLVLAQFPPDDEDRSAAQQKVLRQYGE